MTEMIVGDRPVDVSEYVTEANSRSVSAAEVGVDTADGFLLGDDRSAPIRKLDSLARYGLSQQLGHTPPPLIDWMAEDSQKIQQERPILKKELDIATQHEVANEEKTNAADDRLRSLSLA